MDPTIILVLGIVTGLIVGILIAWLLFRARVAETQGRLTMREQDVGRLEERIGLMDKRIDELNETLRAESEKRAASDAKAERTGQLENANTKLREELSEIQTEHARLTETIEQERKAVEKQLRLVEESKIALTDTFKALAGEALKSSNEEFIKLAKSSLETLQTKAEGDLTERRQAIESLVKPLRESLERYEKQLADMGKERKGQYQSLADQMKALIDSEQSLKDETSKLVTALSAPQVRGAWGELTLRRVAELAGMVERCDFVEQESTDTDSGRLRPDMIVDLPNGRRIVVDAKAPLKAYIEAIECSTEEDRKAKLAEHARQVRIRVNELSKKEYWDQFDEAPEFTVLFLPGEQFLGAALQEQPDLLEDAFKQKVIIATPTTLIALLKAVAYGWRQEALAENAKKISELGKELYERIATLAGHMQDLGKKLDGSVEAYNKSIGSLERRVLVTARKFKELGATGADDISTPEPIDQSTRKMIPVSFEVEEQKNDPTATA